MASVCPTCKLPVDSSCVSYKSKKYHPACLEALKSAARAKDTKLAAKAADPARKELNAFLLRLWEVPDLPFVLDKQIEQYSKQYSLEDIAYALHFFFELEGNEVPPEPTIGIVPHVMGRALEHRRRINDAAAANASFVPRETCTTIHIRHPSLNGRNLLYSIDEL